MKVRFILLLGLIYTAIGLLTFFTSFLWVGIIQGKDTPVIHEEIKLTSRSEIPSVPENPSYFHQLTFNPVDQSFSGKTLLTAWNRTEIETGEVHLQFPILAFEKGKESPVLPEFASYVYAQGKTYSFLTIDQLLLNQKPVPYVISGSDVKILLPKSWKPSERIEISMSWKGRLPMIYHRFGGEDGSYWFGNFFPTLGVYDGRWHTYAYEKIGDPFFSEVSTMKVEIIAPMDYTVAATGEKTESIEDGMKKTVVSANEVRDFGFALTRDHQVETMKTENGISLSFYYKDLTREEARAGLEESAEMLRFLSERLGPYPMKSLSLFENKMFISGMEYSGFILLDAKKYKPETAAHEVAHQWFYHLIGNDQVMEPWLDEAFVTYYTNRFFQNNRLPEVYKEIEKNWVKDGKPKLKKITSFRTWNQYWKITYSYGSLLLYDLEKQMGRERFDQLMKKYVSLYQGKIATTEDFIQLAEEISGIDLRGTFAEHIE